MPRFSKAEYEVRVAIDQARDDYRRLSRGGHHREATAASKMVVAGQEVISLLKRIEREERERIKELDDYRKIRPYSTPRTEGERW